MWGAVLLDTIYKLFDALHPLFWPFLPYWILILTALLLTPLTILTPQALSGTLTWPKKEDTPNEWTIHGKRYNLKAFYDQHPGGSWVLRAAKGSDCTGLFESCHTFIDRKVLLGMLDRFEIKDGVEASKPVMVYNDPFYEDLKKMARDHFKGRPRGSHKMTAPHLALSASTLVLYWVLIYMNVVHWQSWACVPLIGFLSWYLTGNMMHDGSHNALVSTPWLNRALSHAAFPYGVNVSGWTIQHVMSHHIYTNMEDHDVDLYHFDPILILKKGEGTVHIVLHYIRIIFLMSTAVAHLALVVPYGLITGHVDPKDGHAQYDRVMNIQSTRAELRRDMVTQVMMTVLFFAWVGYHNGFINGICQQMSILTISGLFFAFFTQVSHLQEECHMDNAEDWDKLSFAMRQVKSSMDFSADSAVWGHISGGLNTQAIHHCFPSISAMHLRAMYPGFREVCKKHGVELKEAPSLSSFLLGFVAFSN
jgi:fatty acid desaturase